MAAHDRLLGNLNRFKRKLTGDPKCFICGGEDESTLHMLRDCPAAKSVWRKLEGFANLSSLYQGGLQEWIRNNMEFENIETWPTLFAITTWWLWRWRNMMLFDRRSEIPLDLIAFLKVRFDEAWKALQEDWENETKSQFRRKEELITWTSPPLGWHVLNTDGAARGSPSAAGGGAIIRNHCGTFLSAITLNFGSCHALRAEVLALLRGLELARNLHVSNLIVQLDSQTCVQAIHAGSSNVGGCTHLIKKCVELLKKEDWRVKVIHIYREGNRAADWLADRGVEQHHAIQLFEEAIELYHVLKSIEKRS